MTTQRHNCLPGVYSLGGGEMDPFTNTPNPRHMGVVLDKRCKNGEKGVIAGVTGEAS